MTEINEQSNIVDKNNTSEKSCKINNEANLKLKEMHSRNDK